MNNKKRNIKKIAAAFAVVTIALSLVTFKVIHDKEVKEVITLGYTQEVARKKVTLYNFYNDPSKILEDKLASSNIKLEEELQTLGYRNNINNDLTLLDLNNSLKTELTNLKNELNNQIAIYTKLFNSNKIKYSLDTESNLKEQVTSLTKVYETQIESIKKDLKKYNSKVKLDTLKNESIEIEYKNYTQEVASSKKAYDKKVAEEKAKLKALEEQRALEQQYVASNNYNNYTSNYSQSNNYQAPSTSNGANNNYVAPTTPPSQPQQEVHCSWTSTCSDAYYKAGNPNYGGSGTFSKEELEQFFK